MENTERLIKILTHFVKLEENMRDIDEKAIIKNTIVKKKIDYLCKIINDDTIEELKYLSNWLDEDEPFFDLSIENGDSKRHIIKSLYYNNGLCGLIEALQKKLLKY